MKAMTKQELATCAGVSVKTMNNWLSPYREQLWDMGMPRNRGYIPPNVVKWLSERFCIDIPP